MQSQQPVRRNRRAVVVVAALAVVATVLTLTVSSLRASSSIAGAAAVGPRALTASSAMSLTLPGVAGEGTSRSPSDIEVDGYSWGVQNASTAAKPVHATFSTLTMSTPVDQASPLLVTAVAARQVFPTVTLHVAPSQGTKGDSEVITLSNATLRSKSDCCSVGAGFTEPETASLSFSFTKITIDYTNAATGHTVHGGWNVATNKPA